jgi:hypothetical protein
VHVKPPSLLEQVASSTQVLGLIETAHSSTSVQPVPSLLAES